jgi:hypothetical protein
LSLTDVIPSPYRQFAGAAILVGLAAGSFGYGFVKGDDHGSQKYVAQMLAETKTAIRVVQQQGAITVQVVDHYITRILQVKQNTQELQNDVRKDLQMDYNLSLPASFRLLHDTAASGSLPTSPAGAATTPATAAEAAR